jgi:hypothetical protein
MNAFKKFLLTLFIKLGFCDSPDFLSQITSDHPARDALPENQVLVVGGPGFKKWAYLKCPCGCGDFIMLSLSKKTRPRWSVSFDFFNRPTINPSIHQTSGCMSHFWIRKGDIDWCEDTGKHLKIAINI